MSYVGDESLFESLWGTLKAKGVIAHVTYGEPQSSNERSRRMWSDDLKVEIERLKTISNR
jgi:1-acyl-sn-glycerol-3-phosphate acyltransferase